MTLLGRLRAAFGRDEAALLKQARADLRMGMMLNPPANLTPLSRAIAVLERARPGPEVSVLLGRALRAKAQALNADGARDLRARAVAKLKMQLEKPGLTEVQSHALYAALAQAWMPLAASRDSDEQKLHQLQRAQAAQDRAGGSAPALLAMAEIEFALSRHPLCPHPQAVAQAALGRLTTAAALGLPRDDHDTAEALHEDLLRAFPALMPPVR